MDCERTEEGVKEKIISAGSYRRGGFRGFTISRLPTVLSKPTTSNEPKRGEIRLYVGLHGSQLFRHVTRRLIIGDDSDDVVHGVAARSAFHPAGIGVSNVDVNEI